MEEKIERHLPWKALFGCSIVGIFFVIINFPNLSTKIIDAYLINISIKNYVLFSISTIQFYIRLLIGPSPEYVFKQLMGYNFLLLWVYFIAVILFMVRHRDFKLLFFCFFGLILGYFALHAISWIAIVIVKILLVIVLVLGWVHSMIATLMKMIGALLNFIFIKGWWVILILTFSALFFVFRKKILKFMSLVLGISIIGYLAYTFGSPLWRWFLQVISPVLKFIKLIMTNYIVPVLKFILSILFWIFCSALWIFGSLLIFNTFGRLIVDQMRAAYHSGTGRKGIALGGFAIGSALALILLTSVAAPLLNNGVNNGWSYSFEIIDSVIGTNISNSVIAGAQPTKAFLLILPNSVKNFIFLYLTNIKPPIVDSVLFFLIVFISIISITIKLIPSKPEVPTKISVTFYPKEYLVIIGGLLLWVMTIFLGSFEEE